MPRTDSPTPSRPRRHDLDWLRVIAVTLVVFFHAAMPYVAEYGWHLKDSETSHALLEVNVFLSRWRMPLLFLIAGVGTSYALGDRAPLVYLRTRMKRLLVPLALGIVVIVPPQIYVERRLQGLPYRSFLEFWPRVLELRPYPAGDTSWHHLWFIAYLALYSAALLPLFAWLRGARRARLESAAARLVARVGLPVFALPLALPLVLLQPRFPGPENLVQDWARVGYYMLYVVYGYLLARADALWDRIRDDRVRSLRLAVLGTIAVSYFRWNSIEPPMGYSVARAAYLVLGVFAAWCTILAILGFARVHLDRSSAALRYLNEGTYPVYVLHQSVIVVLALYVTPLREGVAVEFAFLALVSLAVTWGLYESLVRPFRIMRFLFGMPPARVDRSLAVRTAVPMMEGAHQSTPAPRALASVE